MTRRPEHPAQPPVTAPAAAIERELAWFEEVVRHRFALYFGETGDETSGEAGGEAGGWPAPPDQDGDGSPFAGELRRLDPTPAERLVLMLALAPHLAPEVLDPFLLQNQATGRRFSEFGGLIGQSHNGFLPTVETALFLLAGSDRAARIAARSLFAPGHRLVRQGLLTIGHRHPEEPPGAAALGLSRDQLERMLTGAAYVWPSGEGFPAERIGTPLTWDDLVLDGATRRQIALIDSWIHHSHTLLHGWGLAQRLKPGYRCLFYGPPGTGKTLTACLLGKHHDLPVYRVDLSRVMSKWVGETEKNLAGLFDRAQHHNWILFFDEAEALFGKRTDAQSANDRAANQQIAYLLQRLEDFPGVVILATNQRGHMDEAFARRFQSSILFPMPDRDSRRALWEGMFRTPGIPLAAGIDFQSLADQHELAGGAIVNVLRHACLLAVERDPPCVQLADIMSGIRQELRKEGHFFNR
ncbi:ATP-binding protein [Azospirillum thermophilum]|uniref:AAA family ATPase n=1 Tax=Azospirillum thermophilum TaxID=2202148 RepID=A0A2S2D045_9PROT|nr:ATP-binding protein [Azospirillum thermophilum]AWK90131.1 AAA family ATPase [Azospirillum thermophilum]